MNKRLLVLPVAAIAAIGVATVPAGAASSTSITLKDDVFVPKAKTIKKNTTVTFKWAGRAPHNVTYKAKGSSKTTKGKFKNSTTKTAGTYKFKFRTAGTYVLTCTIHPGMDLTLKVK